MPYSNYGTDAILFGIYVVITDLMKKNIRYIKILLGIILFGCLIFLPIIFVDPISSVVNNLNPLLVRATTIFTLLSIFIFIPLALVKKTRTISAYGLLISSIVFSLSVWVYSFFIAWYFWGRTGAQVGLFLSIIGIIPVGFIAAVVNQSWQQAFSIVYGLFLVFLSHGIAQYLGRKIEQDNYPFGDNKELLTNKSRTPNPSSSSKNNDSIYTENLTEKDGYLYRDGKLIDPRREPDVYSEISMIKALDSAISKKEKLNHN